MASGPQCHASHADSVTSLNGIATADCILENLQRSRH